jgi:hypothetical protein
MALFQRKNKTTLAAEIVAEMQKAGMASSPLGSGGGYNSAYAANEMSTAGQGIVTTVGQAVPMPRPGFSEGGGGFGAMLGPAAPLLPAPIDVVLDDSGRALPRKYEYQTAINLNITQTEVPFQVLHSLVEQCDIIHRAIEIRVGDIIKQEGAWTLSDQAIADIMQEESCSHAKAALIGRERYGAEINRLRDFWENPYVSSDRSFSEWLTESLWQVFTYDQWCVYPRYNFGGKVIGFDVIDAPTIKLLLNNRGDRPSPPEPFAQQVLWGFPRGEFIASPDADGEFYAGSGKNKEFLTDQLSVFIKNRRTWSAYGYSPVEESIPAASLYLNRQVWMNSEYQNGSTPQTWMRTNSQELDIHKLAEFERILNGRLTGNTAERHRIKVLPDGFEPVAMPTTEERFKADYDEYIIKRVASIFGVSPAALGVVARAGLGGGKGAQEGENENVESVSTKPMEDYVVSVINSLSRRYLGADKNVTFVLNDRKSAREEGLRSKALETALFSGQKTLNDVQGELGQNLYDMPEADEPFIVAGNTVTFLKGLLNIDAQGETIEQVQDGHLLTETQVSQVQENSQSQVGEGNAQVGVGESQAPKAGVGKDIPAVGAPSQKSAIDEELKDFGRFVKSRHKRGNWRSFDFTVFDAELADNLNEQAYFIVKGAAPMPDNIYEWASGIVNSEITDTPKGLVTKRNKEDLPGFQHRIDLKQKHVKDVQAALAASVTGIAAAVNQAHASIPAAGTDISAVRSIAQQAVQHNIKTDTKPGTQVLTRLYTEAANVGATRAAKEVKGVPTVGKTVEQLLNEAKLTITNINATTLTRISDALTIGMHQGQGRKDLYDAVNSIINDPVRAEMITITETSRSYNAGLSDTFAAAGIEQFNWIAYSTACPECDDMESNNPYNVGSDEPPLHPNCECDMEPITPEFQL